nr:MAG TPA: hypothetical protein [Caudoviricetes sp.]
MVDFFGVSGIIIISVAHGAIVCRHYPAKGVELKYVIIYMLQRKAAWSYDCAAFLFFEKKAKYPLTIGTNNGILNSSNERGTKS